VWLGESLTSGRYIPPPYSGLYRKPSKKQAEVGSMQLHRSEDDMSHTTSNVLGFANEISKAKLKNN
jgi:hypothetical protein